ncbi:MAG: glycosyltransferase [Candidatus Thermoplasmatota archaeon]|nr:glycosyltransferase [Candidatus Thermoplasmatota archaeon]
MKGDVTVVIAGRNRLNFLKQTISSILGGSVIPDEIIYVDTGSTDDVISEIKQGFPSLTVVQISGGNPQKARNIGGRMANTTYILFSDDDIAFSRECISDAIRYMSSNREIGMVGWRLSLANGMPSPFSYTVMVPGFIGIEGKKKLWHGLVSVFTVRNAYFIRKELWEKIRGWDEDLFIQYDENDLSIRIYLSGYLVCCIGDSSIVDLNSVKRDKFVIIPELGIDRSTLGVRNSVLVAIKNLSFPIMLISLPAIFILTLGRGIVQGGGLRMLKGYSLALRDLSKPMKSRSYCSKKSFRFQFKLMFSNLTKGAQLDEN